MYWSASRTSSLSSAALLMIASDDMKVIVDAMFACHYRRRQREYFRSFVEFARQVQVGVVVVVASFELEAGAPLRQDNPQGKRQA